MKRMSVVRLALVALACATMQSFATTWYVDAENGNDDWNGQANFANAVPASNIGPKKTLAVFTNLLANSDTIYAAPGWYTNGVAMVYTNNLPEKLVRFYTAKSYISLIATGCATNTFISGAPDATVNLKTSPFGCGPKAIGAIKMTGGHCLVKGFTICNGRGLTWEDKGFNYGAGGYFTSTDRMVDCVVTNCAANRGGGVYQLGYALRCRFTGNYGANGSHAMKLGTAVNCIFENADGYAVYNVNSSGKILNCLFRGNKQGNCRTNAGTIDVWNSVLLCGSVQHPQNKFCYFYNCLFDFDPLVSSEEIRGTNEECRVVATRLLKFTDDGLPMRGNVGVDAATVSYYNDNFPSVFDASEKAYDCLGNARTVGATMDLGAVECPAGIIDDNTWFVDANNGDDANSGKTSEQAFRTLARASTNALMKAGATIYVAEGLYDQGVVPAAIVGSVENSTDCRLLVSSVDVVATGRRAATIIKGASDTAASAAGIGPNAVRCCTMVGGTLTGFTLQNGNVNVGNPDAPFAANYDEGGGVFGLSSPYVFDCEIKNCNAVRGGGAAGVTLVCCYVHDNGCSITGVVATPTRSAAGNGLFSCSAYNTVVKSDGCYTGSYYLNCTLTGSCWGGNSTFANCYIGKDGAAAPAVAAKFYNCVCAKAFTTNVTVKVDCIENKPCQFSSKWRPRNADDAVVNAGNYTRYVNNFPSFLGAYSFLDYVDQPRVLGGCIDIGAAEYKPIGMTVNFK